MGLAMKLLLLMCCLLVVPHRSLAWFGWGWGDDDAAAADYHNDAARDDNNDDDDDDDVTTSSVAVHHAFDDAPLYLQSPAKQQRHDDVIASAAQSNDRRVLDMETNEIIDSMERRQATYWILHEILRQIGETSPPSGSMTLDELPEPQRRQVLASQRDNYQRDDGYARATGSKLMSQAVYATPGESAGARIKRCGQEKQSMYGT